MYQTALWIILQCIIMAYPDLYGFRIGGKLGCLMYGIVTNIPALLEHRISLSYLELMCANVYDITINFDIFQFMWFQLVSKSVMCIADSIFRYVFGMDSGEKKKKKHGIWRFLFSFVFISYLVLYSPNTSWFEQDRVKDMLTLPKEIRNIERKVCPGLRPSDELLFMKGGCALNFVASQTGARFL